MVGHKFPFQPRGATPVISSYADDALALGRGRPANPAGWGGIAAQHNCITVRCSSRTRPLYLLTAWRTGHASPSSLSTRAGIHDTGALGLAAACR